MNAKGLTFCTTLHVEENLQVMLTRGTSEPYDGVAQFLISNAPRTLEALSHEPGKSLMAELQKLQTEFLDHGKLGVLLCRRRCGDPPMKPLTAIAVCCAFSISAGAAEHKESLADLYERVGPSVVEIATIQEIIADKGPAKRMRSGGLGSGFLVSEDGLIMTASHVVQMAEDVAVRWVNGEVSKAKIISSNPNADVALLKAESVPDTIKPLILGRFRPGSGGRRGLHHRRPQKLCQHPDRRIRERTSHTEGSLRRHRARGIASDRRGHQRGQLRRSDVQHGWRSHRCGQPHLLPIRWLPGVGICRDVEHGSGRDAREKALLERNRRLPTHRRVGKDLQPPAERGNPHRRRGGRFGIGQDRPPSRAPTGPRSKDRSSPSVAMSSSRSREFRWAPRISGPRSSRPPTPSATTVSSNSRCCVRGRSFRSPSPSGICGRD